MCVKQITKSALAAPVARCLAKPAGGKARASFVAGSLAEYRVSRSRGGFAVVIFSVSETGQRLASCSCPAGQSGKSGLCYHVAAALWLHCFRVANGGPSLLPAPVSRPSFCATADLCDCGQPAAGALLCATCLAALPPAPDASPEIPRGCRVFNGAGAAPSVPAPAGRARGFDHTAAEREAALAEIAAAFAGQLPRYATCAGCLRLTKNATFFCDTCTPANAAAISASIIDAYCDCCLSQQTAPAIALRAAGWELFAQAQFCPAHVGR